MARTNAGRTVTGKLVQDQETGYWHEEVPVTAKPRRWRGEVLNVAGIIAAAQAGRTLQEIGVEILSGRDVTRPQLASLYRAIDAVLLGAGIRQKEETSRAFNGRDPNGQANLPAAIEALL